MVGWQKRIRRGKRQGFLSWLKSLSITAWIIIVNVIIYLIITIFFIKNPDNIEQILNNFAVNPVNILRGEYLWTLVVHMFSHALLIHLFVNMFVLYSLGGLCERIIGRKRFFWFYLISGIFAGVLSVLLSDVFGGSELGARIFGPNNIAMLGASGAIFGIAGLFVVLLPRLKFAIIFLPFFSFPAYIMVPTVLFIFWGLTIIFNWPIGNVAHFGGFIAGLGYGYYLRTKYRRKVKMLQRMFR
jgi:membrane associated rhomboid family serine protease